MTNSITSDDVPRDIEMTLMTIPTSSSGSRLHRNLTWPPRAKTRAPALRVEGNSTIQTHPNHPPSYRMTTHVPLTTTTTLPPPPPTSTTEQTLSQPRVVSLFWYGFLFFPCWIWGTFHLIPGIGIKVPTLNDESTKPTSISFRGRRASEEGGVPPSYCESLRSLEQAYPPSMYSTLLALRKVEIKWALRCLYTLIIFGCCVTTVIIAFLKLVNDRNDSS